MENAMSYKRYTQEFKQKILREIEKGDEPVAAVARRYAVGRSLIYEWQQKQEDGALHDTFPDREGQLRRQIVGLEVKVGQLTMENDFLKKTLQRLEQRYPASSTAREPSNASNKRGKRGEG
jgi:transposase